MSTWLVLCRIRRSPSPEKHHLVQVNGKWCATAVLGLWEDREQAAMNGSGVKRWILMTSHERKNRRAKRIDTVTVTSHLSLYVLPVLNIIWLINDIKGSSVFRDIFCHMQKKQEGLRHAKNPRSESLQVTRNPKEYINSELQIQLNCSRLQNNLLKQN